MKQIVIPTHNTPGELADIVGLLSDAGINLQSFDARERSTEHGWVVITVDQYDKAFSLLSQNGYQPISENTIIIRLDDEPGALAKIARRFKDNHLNLKSLHIIRRVAGRIHVSLVADDQEKAAELVSDIILDNDN